MELGRDLQSIVWNYAAHAVCFCKLTDSRSSSDCGDSGFLQINELIDVVNARFNSPFSEEATYRGIFKQYPFILCTISCAME